MSVDGWDDKSGLGLGGTISGGSGAVPDDATSHGRDSSPTERDDRCADRHCPLLHPTPLSSSLSPLSAGRRGPVPTSDHVCPRHGRGPWSTTCLHAARSFSSLGKWGWVITNHRFIVCHRRHPPASTTAGCWYQIVYFIFVIYFLFLVLCCQCQCKWWPGKTCLLNDLLLSLTVTLPLYISQSQEFSSVLWS